MLITSKSCVLFVTSIMNMVFAVSGASSNVTQGAQRLSSAGRESSVRIATDGTRTTSNTTLPDYTQVDDDHGCCIGTGRFDFHQRCGCDRKLPHCKNLCNKDKYCKGYVEEANNNYCQIATTSRCPLHCILIDSGKIGNLSREGNQCGEYYGGCFIKNHVEGCTRNIDCSTEYICINGSCVEACTGDIDCPKGQICKNSCCVEGCDEDEDCPGIEICSSHRCVDTHYAVVKLVQSHQSGITGNLRIEQINSKTELIITGWVNNLLKGVHGFHVHENGATGNDCADAGAHFNPTSKKHGKPNAKERHVGDLGNIESGSHLSPTKINIIDAVISIDKENIGNILNRTIVIHEKADDFSGESGNAGRRLSCGIITSNTTATGPPTMGTISSQLPASNATDDTPPISNKTLPESSALSTVTPVMPTLNSTSDGSSVSTATDGTPPTPDKALPVYVLSEAGHTCSETGMVPIDELNYCNSSLPGIQSVYRNISGHIKMENNSSYPRGCNVFVHKNNSYGIFFNTFPSDEPNTNTRQVCFSECGDRTDHMLENTADEIVLGKVNLETGQSYTFCRNLCKNTYPDFEIYQKFEDYNFCTCSKITPGQNVTIRSHGAYDFGYAKECVYILSEAGHICSDAGLGPIDELNHCNNSVKWIQSVYGNISSSLYKESHNLYPRGCNVFVHENDAYGIFFNTVISGKRNKHSRQVCVSGRQCFDADYGVTDTHGDNCSFYSKVPQACGIYDDMDFYANKSCCACGGGTPGKLSTMTPVSPSPVINATEGTQITFNTALPATPCNHTNNGVTDKYDQGCEHYTNFPDDCGMFDEKDFIAKEMCCACGGGDSSVYFLSEAGHICSDTEMMPIYDLDNCTNAMPWIQSVYTNISNAMHREDHSLYPTGCNVFVHNNKSYGIFFNVFQSNKTNINSRQVCVTDSETVCHNCRAGPCTRWCSTSNWCGDSSAHSNSGTDCRVSAATPGSTTIESPATEGIPSNESTVSGATYGTPITSKSTVTEQVEFRKEQTMQNCKMPFVITNNDTCKSAADFFGLTYKGNFTSDTRPAGCWYQNSDAYFNSIIDPSNTTLERPNDGALCHVGGCSENIDCPTRQICNNSICVEGCSEDDDCPGIEICNNNRCAEECNETIGCKIGEICNDSRCVEGCKESIDCSYGEICENGSCVEPTANTTAKSLPSEESTSDESEVSTSTYGTQTTSNATVIEYVFLRSPNGHPAYTTCETLGCISIEQKDECYDAYKTIPEISVFKTFQEANLSCSHTNPNYCFASTFHELVYFTPDNCPVHANKTQSHLGMVCISDTGGLCPNTTAKSPTTEATTSNESTVSIATYGTQTTSNDAVTDVDCQWSKFGNWGDCSATCGVGIKTRTRTIETEATGNGKPCYGEETGWEKCNEAACKEDVDCEWSKFGDWEDCSATCGGGTKTRTRTVETESAGKGTPCDGQKTEEEACNEDACSEETTVTLMPSQITTTNDTSETSGCPMMEKENLIFDFAANVALIFAMVKLFH